MSSPCARPECGGEVHTDPWGKAARCQHAEPEADTGRRCPRCDCADGHTQCEHCKVCPHATAEEQLMPEPDRDRPRASVIEIIASGRKPTDDGGGSLIVPNEVRINGVSVFTTGNGVKVNEFTLGDDMVSVTLTLVVRKLTIAAASDMETSRESGMRIAQAAIAATGAKPYSYWGERGEGSTDVIDPELAALVLRVLGIELTPGGIPYDEALHNACRQLEKSEAARRHLNRERDELHAEIGLAQGQLHSTALSAIRGKHATIRELIERAEQAEAERNEARMWARHGYEIGQRHCSWSDHGVAPDWLTEGWPNSFDSCEHLKQAAEYDTAICRALDVVAELEAADVHGGAWDANQEAARRIREALRPSNPGNEPTVTP